MMVPGPSIPPLTHCSMCRNPTLHPTEFRSAMRSDGSHAVKINICPACIGKFEENFLAAPQEPTR